MPRDDREIVRAVRMPGKREQVAVGKKAKFVKGPVITDPDILVAEAEARRVNLQQLRDRGIISGNWKGVK